MPNIDIYFDKGSLVIKNLSEDFSQRLPGVRLDNRIHQYRAPGFFYRDIIETLRKLKVIYADHARKFVPMAVQRFSRGCIAPNRFRENNFGRDVDRKNRAAHAGARSHH